MTVIGLNSRLLTKPSKAIHTYIRKIKYTYKIYIQATLHTQNKIIQYSQYKTCQIGEGTEYILWGYNKKRGEVASLLSQNNIALEPENRGKRFDI